MTKCPLDHPPSDSLTTLAEAERDAALRGFEALRAHIQDGAALTEAARAANVSARSLQPDSIIAPDAQDFLVDRLSTPLQFAEHLNRAFTDAFHLGAEKVIREIVENTLSAGFDHLGAKLARIGYTPKALAERFDAQPAEIRRFLSGRLDLERTAELGAALRNASIPT